MSVQVTHAEMEARVLMASMNSRVHAYLDGADPPVKQVMCTDTHVSSCFLYVELFSHQCLIL